ncbi:MAG: type II toxin-antitoxin system RelE/ParE family toxin [Sandarakinorhabdus sp.]|nr:type II toxin-antitoxin system RelE/ParE family toxin [Sandarakinorhabdus sp.]
MTLRIAGPARRDIARLLIWSADMFGGDARQRYEKLLARALDGIAGDDPASSRDASEIGHDLRLYHLRNSRLSGDDRPPVARPRHFLIYRRDSADRVTLLRVLHDASDLPSRFNDPIA